MVKSRDMSLSLIHISSDITYRIFDYNRKDKDGKSRELHTSQAIEAINFTDVQDDFRTCLLYTSSIRFTGTFTHYGVADYQSRTFVFCFSCVKSTANGIRIITRCV